MHDYTIELVSTDTDTLPLDGLFSKPVGRPRALAMILYARCMKFYTGAPRFLPPELASMGLAALAFKNAVTT